jgi:isoleucyl-tRNA synthetase
MPGSRPESVFMSTWAELPDATGAALSIDWDRVLQARAAVLRELERLRVDGRIGAPLDANVVLYGSPEWQGALAALGDELRFVLITSGATVRSATERPAEALPAGGAEAANTGLWLQVEPSSAQKCVRCWHKRDDVGTVAAHPELCARCAGNLDGPGETRRFA